MINTVLLERTIKEQAMIEKLSPRDFAALNPLFHGHVNPYGVFDINLLKASFLEAA